MVEMSTSLRAVLATAAIVAVGALTPGPNNLIVFERGARQGLAGALPAVAAITCGSVILVLLVATSGGFLFQAHSGWHAALLIGASAYLCWLGLRLLFGAPGELERLPKFLPARAWELFAFQFANPKAWAIALTASTALEAYRALDAALLDLVMLFALIPAAGLLLWSSAGARLSRHLRHPPVKRVFDRLMGALLLGSALALIF
jgi:threonine/homoserine/homoserine lactone efflux protein